MESASWQRPLYGFKITQNQAEMPLKSGFSDGRGGGIMVCLVLNFCAWASCLLSRYIVTSLAIRILLLAVQSYLAYA